MASSSVFTFVNVYKHFDLHVCVTDGCRVGGEVILATMLCYLKCITSHTLLQ